MSEIKILKALGLSNQFARPLQRMMKETGMPIADALDIAFMEWLQDSRWSDENIRQRKNG